MYRVSSCLLGEVQVGSTRFVPRLSFVFCGSLLNEIFKDLSRTWTRVFFSSVVGR